MAFETWITQQWLHRHGWAWVSWPLSFIYGLALAWHQRRYRSDRNGVPSPLVKRLPVPVVVIGNLIVGGAGKTPVCLAVVQHLQRQGWSPGIVSRGYARSTDQTAAFFEVQHDTAATLCGDEPLLLKQRTGAVVMVGHNRFEVGAALLQHHPEVNIIILDDGLQHRQLHADVRVLVFDERGLGNGWLLPAGLLREPWPTHTYADELVIRHPHPLRNNSVGQGYERLTRALTQAPPQGIFWAERTLAPVVYGPDGQQALLTVLCDIPSLALAGIAKPQQFFSMLQQQGITLSQTLALTDHASMEELDAALAASFSSFPSLSSLPSLSFSQCFCTEKDSVKLFEIWRKLAVFYTQKNPDVVFPSLWAVRLELTIAPSFFDALNQKLFPFYGHSTS